MPDLSFCWAVEGEIMITLGSQLYSFEVLGWEHTLLQCIMGEQPEIRFTFRTRVNTQILNNFELLKYKYYEL